MNPDAADPAVDGGPLDDAPWPDKLKARVTTPGPDPAIHGYAVEGDLARHYGLAEGVLLALTGELPAVEQAAAFEVAFHFLSPAPVNEAPAHAAVVARICDVTTSAMAGTAAIALAEQAHAVVGAHAGLLAELGAGKGAGAGAWAAADDEERASVARLRAALRERGVVLASLEADVGRIPALLATLWFAGLTRAEPIEAALTLARLPAALAEAFATPSHSYRDYPVLLPPVSYRDPP
jgi:hypothetical protein